jgi:hypothetical protein
MPTPLSLEAGASVVTVDMATMSWSRASKGDGDILTDEGWTRQDLAAWAGALSCGCARSDRRRRRLRAPVPARPSFPGAGPSDAWPSPLRTSPSTVGLAGLDSSQHFAKMSRDDDFGPACLPRDPALGIAIPDEWLVRLCPELRVLHRPRGRQRPRSCDRHPLRPWGISNGVLSGA